MEQKNFLSTLSRIDNYIEDLTFTGEVGNDNALKITKITTQLRDMKMQPLDRTNKCSQLRRIIQDVISQSTVADQICGRWNIIEKKYPKELYNVFYDFRNLKTFKKPALQNTINSLLSLKAQGHGTDVDIFIKLANIRMIHVSCNEALAELNDIAFDIASGKTILNDKSNLSQNRFDRLAEEIEFLKKENIELQNKNIKHSNSYNEQKARNDILSREMYKAKEENEQMKKEFGVEKNAYMIRIQTLTKMASQVDEKDKQIALLREQINSMESLINQQKLLSKNKI